MCYSKRLKAQSADCAVRGRSMALELQDGLSHPLSAVATKRVCIPGASDPLWPCLSADTSSHATRDPVEYARVLPRRAHPALSHHIRSHDQSIAARIRAKYSG